MCFLNLKSAMAEQCSWNGMDSNRLGTRANGVAAMGITAIGKAADDPTHIAYVFVYSLDY